MPVFAPPPQRPRSTCENPFGKPRSQTARGCAADRARHGQAGRRELNFSSDIDLVFLFAHAGETDGPRVIENEEYFNRLGRELIRLLDARNRGRFRVSSGHAPAAVRRERSLGRESCLARGLPAAARPRLGAVCLDQGARHRGCRRLRAGERGVREAVRVSPLSRLRRDRVVARHEGADRARSVAARVSISI